MPSTKFHLDLCSKLLPDMGIVIEFFCVASKTAFSRVRSITTWSFVTKQVLFFFFFFFFLLPDLESTVMNKRFRDHRIQRTIIIYVNNAHAHQIKHDVTIGIYIGIT